MCLAEFCSDYRVLAKSQVPKGKKTKMFLNFKIQKGLLKKEQEQK